MMLSCLLHTLASLYVAKPNTFSNIETPKVRSTKESSEPAPTRVQRTPTVLTHEQESAVISRYLDLAVQERLQRSNASAIYNSTTPNKHESANMGCSHSFSKAFDNIKHNAKNKLPDNIAHRITFSPTIPHYCCNLCLPYITANVATKECIRDLTTDHLRLFFCELHHILLVNDATISDNDDSIEYIQCMQHTCYNKLSYGQLTR